MLLTGKMAKEFLDRAIEGDWCYCRNVHCVKDFCIMNESKGISLCNGLYKMKYRHEIRAGIIESMVQQGYLDKKYK